MIRMPTSSYILNGHDIGIQASAYLIQKTPDMIISLLERLKLHPTTHVIVMRHPFAWNWPFTTLDATLVEKVDFQPIVWLHVWTYVLDLVNKEMIESFAIVNYEMLISRKEAVTDELVDLINRGCGIDVNVKKQTKATDSNFARRRLELHTNKFDASMYLAESKIVKAFTKCDRDVKCRKAHGRHGTDSSATRIQMESTHSIPDAKR